MNFYSKLLLKGFIFFQAYNLYAKELSAEEFATLQRGMAQYQELAVKFKQVIYKNLRKNTVTSSGYVLFSKPNKFRWAKEEPEKEEWVSDGIKLYQFHPSTKEALLFEKNSDKSKELTWLIDLVLNFNTLEKNYKITKILEESSDIIVHMSPLQHSDLNEILCKYSKEKKIVSHVRLNFKNQNYTSFDFFQPHFTSIKAASFELPKETKISESL